MYTKIIVLNIFISKFAILMERMEIALYFILDYDINIQWEFYYLATIR